MRIAFLALSLSLLSNAASAADDINDLEIAKAHYGTGQDYFAAGRYQFAVKEFLEAHRLSGKPLLLYNIALCYEKLDDPGRVTRYYRQYLRERADAPERAEVERKLARLAPRVATVAPTTTVAGAEIWIDGELIGKAPLEPVLVTEGRHHLEARYSDQAPTAIDATLPGGQATAVALEPRAIVPVEKVVVVKAEAPRRRWLWPVVGATAAVVVGAVLGLVLGLTLHPTNYADNARAGCGTPACTLIDLMGGGK